MFYFRFRDFINVIMYSVYVSNKTEMQVYIRLQHEKLSGINPNFHHELDKLKDGKEKGDLSSYLVRWGFTLIPSGQTVPFSVDVANDGPRKYASLCVAYNLWAMDFEMNCMRYGCLFVTRAVVNARSMFHFNQANPEPLWSPANKGEVATNFVKVGFQDGVDVFFGRCSSNGAPRSVSVYCGCLDSWKPITHLPLRVEKSGHILRDTGHEFVRAKAGDPVPPHGVVTGVSEPEGSLYLGRVGGHIPCTISTKDGNIKYFCHLSSQFQSGEILLLTNDSTI